MIVGRFAETAQAGELALAAVGASYPITQLFVAVATGINIGTSVLVSQLFGAKRYLRMKTAISTALVTTTVVALLLTLFGAIFTNGLMSALNTSADIFSDASLYLRVYVFGLLFLFIYNVCTGIFNAMGDSRTPLILLIISSVGNVILDIVFVAMLHWALRALRGRPLSRRARPAFWRFSCSCAACTALTPAAISSCSRPKCCAV